MMHYIDVCTLYVVRCGCKCRILYATFFSSLAGPLTYCSVPKLDRKQDPYPIVAEHCGERSPVSPAPLPPSPPDFQFLCAYCYQFYTMPLNKQLRFMLPRKYM